MGRGSLSVGGEHQLVDLALELFLEPEHEEQLRHQEHRCHEDLKEVVQQSWFPAFERVTDQL
jgi:hypothetical protein